MIADSVVSTDDADGEASVLDDQEMSFFKVTSNSAAIGDSDTLSFTKSATDSAAFTDSGSVISQGYVDTHTYFLEDYVGLSASFTA